MHMFPRYGTTRGRCDCAPFSVLFPSGINFYPRRTSLMATSGTRSSGSKSTMGPALRYWSPRRIQTPLSIEVVAIAKVVKLRPRIRRMREEKKELSASCCSQFFHPVRPPPFFSFAALVCRYHFLAGTETSLPRRIMFLTPHTVPDKKVGAFLCPPQSLEDPFALSPISARLACRILLTCCDPL